MFDVAGGRSFGSVLNIEKVMQVSIDEAAIRRTLRFARFVRHEGHET